MSSREIDSWEAFYHIEPWGFEIENWRAGNIARVIAEVNRDPKRQSEAFTVADFCPNLDPDPASEQTDNPESLFQQFVGMFKR